MQYIPINCNNFTSEFIAPTSVKSINNITFAFWERALFQRAISVLDFTLPDEWEGDVRDFFHYVLFREGRVIVFNYNEYGLIFQPGGLSGFDLYYRPTNALIANPAFSESLDLKIGSDCEVLKLTPDYIGIWDIISYYAEKLSLLDNAINMSLINNKFAFMIGAKNKAAANAIKKMLDLINRGEPAVIYDTRVASDPVDTSEPWNLWERKNLKESYLTTMQLQDFRTIINNFDSEIGIPTLAIMIILGQVIKETGIIPALPIARAALSGLSESIVYIDGIDMKNTLNNFYSALNIQLTDDSIYYEK